VREDWAVPPGLETFLALFPALKRWAKLVRLCRGWIPELLRDQFQLVGPKKKRERRSAPLLAFLFQELGSYLLELPLISAFSVAPMARAYFLPAKRTWETVALPLAWSTTAAS
jgi:hypothetical protein